MGGVGRRDGDGGRGRGVILTRGPGCCTSKTMEQIKNVSVGHVCVASEEAAAPPVFLAQSPGRF